MARNVNLPMKIHHKLHQLSGSQSKHTSHGTRTIPPFSGNPLLFSSISVDLVTGLPDSHGFDLVMVVVDHGLMKGVIYYPCTKNIDMAGLPNSFSFMFSLDLASIPR